MRNSLNVYNENSVFTPENDTSMKWGRKEIIYFWNHTIGVCITRGVEMPQLYDKVKHAVKRLIWLLRKFISVTSLHCWRISCGSPSNAGVNILFYRWLQELEVTVISQQQCQRQWSHGKGKVEVTHFLPLQRRQLKSSFLRNKSLSNCIL
jgi:hypothetical protein